MTPWGNPDSWMDVLDHLWLGLVLVAVAGIPSFFAARNHQSIRAIKDQVVNGHTSPMRADLDKALAAIADLAIDVRGLREDLLTEEDRRRRDVAELETRIGRHRRQDY